MMRRHQLPTHSPLHARALMRGLRGALGRDRREQLRADLRTHWSADDAVLTDSGTSALQLALRAAVAARPGPVALPAYACYDIATAAMGADVRVILYDLDPDTLSPDAESLRSALEQRPSALVLIHAFGIPVDVPAISRVVPNDTVIIEDAAQAFGATIRGEPAGRHGTLGILSFGRGKGLTGGGGGAILTRDDRGTALVQQVAGSLSGSGSGWSEWIRSAIQWALARPTVYAIPASLPFLRLGETVFREPHEPAMIARSASAMVHDVWAAAHAAVAIRLLHAKRLGAQVESIPGWRTARPIPEASAGYLRFPVRHTSRSRSELLTADARRLGIVEGYPRPLGQLPGFRDRCINAEVPMPGAEVLADTLMVLPTHGLLSAHDLEQVESWLLEFRGREAPLSGTHAVA